MSRFSGRQYRGAARDQRAAKRNEAEQRQADYEAAGRPGSTTYPRLGRKLREGIA